MSQRTREARQRDARRRSQARVVALVVGAIVVAGAAVLVGSMLSSDDDGTSPSSDGSGATRVSLTEFAFDPDPIVVQHGDGATLDVVNDGAVPHDLVIGELGKGTPDLPAGEHLVLDLSDQPIGTYRVVCDLPGHTEAGMVTELVIE